MKESNFESFPKTAECELKTDISLLIIDHLILLQNNLIITFPISKFKTMIGSEIHLFQPTQENFLLLKKN